MNQDSNNSNKGIILATVVGVLLAVVVFFGMFMAVVAPVAVVVHEVTGLLDIPGDIADGLWEDIQGNVDDNLQSKIRADFDCSNMQDPRPLGKFNASDANCKGALAASGTLASSSQVPDDQQWLMPIFKVAANQYDVPWLAVAALNWQETNWGESNCHTDKGIGWMQFSADTWDGQSGASDREPIQDPQKILDNHANGIDGGSVSLKAVEKMCGGKKTTVYEPRPWTLSFYPDNKANPYDPVDAIFAAARYLHNHGYRSPVELKAGCSNNANTGSEGGSPSGDATAATGPADSGGGKSGPNEFGDELEGHKLPAATGFSGYEDSISPQGTLVHDGGTVSYYQLAQKVSQPYRDYAINMRIRTVYWGWGSNTKTPGPEKNPGWYSEKPRLILVTNPRTKKSVITTLLETGPAAWTGTKEGQGNPPAYWQGFQDGTPPQYKGRVSGLTPKAYTYLQAKQGMADGTGDKLIYKWAPNQNAKPGPTDEQGTATLDSGGCDTSTDSTDQQVSGGVAMFGDSITVMSKGQLKKAIPDLSVYAQGSKHLQMDASDKEGGPAGLTLIKDQAASLPANVVIALGTNDEGTSKATFEKWVKEAMKTIGDGHTVTWVNTTNNANANAAIAAVAKTNDSMKIADWKAVAKLGNDHIHPTTAGQKAFAKVVADTVGVSPDNGTGTDNGAAAAATGTPTTPISGSNPKPDIVKSMIPFPAKRQQEMKAYAKRHYGMNTYLLQEPKVIVEHYTETSTYQQAYNTFAPDVADSELHELPGTCAHFIIDKDGTIHQLVSLKIMCRHTVGLNYTAIGIEIVGSSETEIIKRKKQYDAAQALTKWLQDQYNIDTANVIGHNESLSSSYHKENVARLKTQTHDDWNKKYMDTFRKDLGEHSDTTGASGDGAQGGAENSFARQIDVPVGCCGWQDWDDWNSADNHSDIDPSSCTIDKADDEPDIKKYPEAHAVWSFNHSNCFVAQVHDKYEQLFNGLPFNSSNANGADGSNFFANGSLAARVFAAADQLDKMKLPYCYGGGHDTTPATPNASATYCWQGGAKVGAAGHKGLDCSSSVSWVLQHAGVREDGKGLDAALNAKTTIRTRTSDEFHSTAFTTPGKKGAVVIYGNAGHVWMTIGNAEFSTSATNPDHGPGWVKPGTEGGGGGYTPDTLKGTEGAVATNASTPNAG